MHTEVKWERDNAKDDAMGNVKVSNANGKAVLRNTKAMGRTKGRTKGHVKVNTKYSASGSVSNKKMEGNGKGDGKTIEVTKSNGTVHVESDDFTLSFEPSKKQLEQWRENLGKNVKWLRTNVCVPLGVPTKTFRKDEMVKLLRWKINVCLDRGNTVEGMALDDVSR